MSKKYLDSKGLSYLWQKVRDKYIQKQSIPTVENELIYFDTDEGFISNQLLLQDDVLFVNTQEDYDLCTKTEGIETDVLGSWQQFQCNTNNTSESASNSNGKYNKTISPEYGKGVLGNTTGLDHPASGYGWWYNDGANIKNDINSGDFNGYILPFSKNRYSFDTLFGCYSNTYVTSGDQIGFSIVNDKHALPRRVETTDGTYYRNTLYDKVTTNAKGFKYPTQSAWVKEDKINSTAKVIFTASPTTQGTAESFPTIGNDFVVYDIENIQTSEGRKNPIESTTTVKIASTHEAAGYLGFLTVVVTNSTGMELAQGVGENYTSNNTGTIYVFGSVFDIKTQKWNSTKIIDGNNSASGDYWKLGKNLVKYNAAYNGNEASKTCIIRCNASYDNGKLEILFGDPVAYTDKDNANFNGSKLSFDFTKKTYSFEPYHNAAGNPIYEIKHNISLPNFVPTVNINETSSKQLSNDEFWNLFTGDTKFMYNAYSYEYLYIEVLNMLTDNRVIWVNDDGTNTEYGLNEKRTEYVSKGNIQTQECLTGSRLAYNPLTKKLFYSNGEKIYQIAGSTIKDATVDIPVEDITEEEVKYIFDSILNAYSFGYQREITENIKVRRLEPNEKYLLNKTYGVDWNYINIDNKIQEGAKGKIYSNEEIYIDEISDIKYTDLTIGGTLFNCNSVIIPEDDYNVYEFTYKYLSGIEGTNSFAEGDATLASGNSSHAEGEWNTAYGDYSHAEGESTTAQGQASHTEGEDTLAIGDASHAEGSRTLAVGNYSHTEGCDTVAQNAYEHSQGVYNVSNKESETFGNKNTIFSIGIGESGENRKNALEVLQNGAIYINGIGDYDGTNALRESDSTGKIAKPLQESSLNSSSDSSTKGYVFDEEKYAFIEGENHEWLKNTIIPYKVHKLNYEEKEALGFYSGGIGIDYDYCIDCQDKTIHSIIYDDNKLNLSEAQIKSCSGSIGIDGNIILQTANTSNLYNNITLKFFNLDLYNENDELITLDNDTEYYFSYPDVGYSSHSEGSGSIGIGLASHAEGSSSIGIGLASHAEGNDTTAQGLASHAEGNGSHARGEASHAEGSGSIGLGNFSHAEGSNTKAEGNSSHAEGDHSHAKNYASHAEGASTHAEGFVSHAEGASTYAIGDYSHSEGDNSRAEGFASHSEGQNTKASGNYSHAEGYYHTTASGTASHAEGSETTAANVGSHSEGRNSKAFGNASHAEGNGSITGKQSDLTTNYGYCSHAEGYQTNAIYNYSHTEGYQTSANGEASHTEGYKCVTGGSATTNNLTASNKTTAGFYAHAEGNTNIAKGNSSHAEGKKNFAGGNFSHAEGNVTVANGTASHAEGSQTTATGNYSHSEGYLSKAQGLASHAEGSSTESNNDSSHAEGKYTKVVSKFGHAEGYSTIVGTILNEGEENQELVEAQAGHAEGYQTKSLAWAAHAEGDNTTASGNCSHAEGNYCEATAKYAHSEGNYTIASGEASHSEGYCTCTTNEAEHAEGKYNISNIGTISSIGIGSGEDDRKNAFEVMENGDTFIFGVGDYDGTNITTTNKNGERLPASIQEVLPKYNKENRSVCFQYNEADGSLNEAQSDYSFVIGYNNKAIREETDENGLTLQSANSFVGGMNNRAYHSNSIVFGEGLFTQFGNTFVLGKYNSTVPNQDDWGDTVLGIVGDGYKDSSGNVTGRNVLLIQGGNDPSVHCRGSFKNNASWINDFGEYFEWLDGNPDNEDRIGYMVQLNGDKIELATSLKKCIGVISGTTGFIGGVCAFEWHNKFLHDKWGREIIGEDGNPVINPDYNPELEYIPREQRKEWDVVGLVGQVITRQDGTLEVGGYAGCNNGIATNATRGFKVLKIIDNETALLLVK